MARWGEGGEDQLVMNVVRLGCGNVSECQV